MHRLEPKRCPAGGSIKGESVNCPRAYLQRQRMLRFVLAWAGAILLFASAISAQQQAEPIFNKNFEGSALGKIERLGDGRYRCFVEGQQDERGRNRLANWYYFRIDGVKDRNLTVILTDLVGEYNDKPGAVAMNA